MLAYHSKQEIKDAILVQLREHQAADEIIKGQYWEGGKGCAVACTIHSDNYVEYETRFGIPQMLAWLEDCIFEGLPNVKAKEWPVRFMAAIEPNKDLSRVGWKFLHWILTDETVNPGINHPLVKHEVKRCADVLVPLTKGEPVDVSAAKSAAENAAKSAKSAAKSAVWSAENAAWSAVLSTESAAWSATKSAENAAENSAWSAAKSAESAAKSTENAAYVKMADKLIELLEAA